MDKIVFLENYFVCLFFFEPAIKKYFGAGEINVSVIKSIDSFLRAQVCFQHPYGRLQTSIGGVPGSPCGHCMLVVLYRLHVGEGLMHRNKRI